MRTTINNVCLDISIDYNNELLFNDNKVIFSNDSNLFNIFDENTDIIKIPYCGQPESKALIDFIKTNNIYTDYNHIEKSFIHNVIVFEDDEK